MPLYVAKATRQVTVVEEAEINIEADSLTEARRKARKADALDNANWRENDSRGYKVGDMTIEVELLANGDERLPEDP